MAYIVKSSVVKSAIGSDSLTVEINLPAHQTGDLLVVHAVKDDATGGALSITGGWAQIQQSTVGVSGNNTVRAAAWYKIAASSSEANPIVTSTDADAWSCLAMNIRDFDAATPIDSSNVIAISVAGYVRTGPTLTTTTDNCLVIHLNGCDNLEQLFSPPPLTHIASNDDGASTGEGASWQWKETAGAITPCTFYGNSNGAEQVIISFAVKNLSSSTIVPAHPCLASPISLLHPLHSATAIAAGSVTGNNNDFSLLGMNVNPTAAFLWDVTDAAFTDILTDVTSATDADISFGATPEIQNIIYLGFDNQINSLRFDRAGCTAGTVGTIAKEYWNGTAWVGVSNLYEGTTSLTVAVGDHQIMSWRKPTNEVQTAVNGVTKYWTRLRVSTGYTVWPTISQIIGGKALGLQFDAIASVGDTGVDTQFASHGSSPGFTGNMLSGATFAFGQALDVSSGIIVGSFIFGNPRDFVDVGNVVDCGVPFSVIDASNRGKTWSIGGQNAIDCKPDARNIYAIQPSQSTASHYCVSDTAPTLTDFRKMLMASNNRNGTSVVNYSWLVKITGPIIVCGGSAATPANWSDVESVLNHHPLPLISAGYCYSPIQFGGGADTLKFVSGPFALRYRKRADIAAGYVLSHVDDNFFGVLIKAGANDTVKLISGSITGESPVYFTIDIATSASCTYDFTALVLDNSNVTLRILNFYGMTFLNCPSFAQNARPLNTCTINNTPFTVDGTLTSCSVIASLLTTANPLNFLNCAFTSSGSGHAIEITATGTFDFKGNTFSGFGADGTANASLHNNSGGLVTLNLNAGDTIPTVLNGSGSSTVFDVAAVMAHGQVDWTELGSTIEVYNVTKDAQVYSAITSGVLTWSVDYLDGTTFSAGDSGRVRVRKAGFEPIERTFTAASGGWGVNAPQESDPHYTVVTPVNVTVDYGNKKIRATGARASFSVQEVQDIIRVAEATLSGIELPEFANVSGLIELSAGVTTGLTIQMIDWQISWASGSVAQATISGGNLVGGIANDPVEDVAGGPQVTNNLSAAATQVSSGGAIPTAAEIAAEVWSYTTRELTAGGGTTAEEIRIEMDTNSTQLAAIKERTDNLPSDPASETNVNLRLLSADYTAPLNASITDIKAKTDQLNFTGANVQSIAAVVSDKTGYALTAGERTAISVAVEAALINDTDGQALLAAIVASIGNQNVDEIALVAAIRADIERANGMLETAKNNTVTIIGGVF